MKKTIITIAFALVIMSGSAFGQGSLPLGSTQLNLGAGLSEWGIPFYIGFDHSAHKDVTLGVELSFREYSENWKNRKYNHSVVGFSGNANYHFNSAFNISPDWDFYGGINLGFYSWSSPQDYDGSHTSGLGFGGQIGGRYFVSNNVGINLEFGSGNAFSGGKLGLTFKL
jgi:outer membrane immunogenic protein